MQQKNTNPLLEWSIPHFFQGILSNMRGSKTKGVRSGSSESESGGAKDNPQLAIGHGRSDTRGYIDAFRRRLQSSLQESSRVARVLSKSTRIEETEGVREKAEARVRSAVEITRLIVQPGFKHYLSLFDRLEADAYFSLRAPASMKKDGMSLEYYIGYYAGVLNVVDDFKSVADMANVEVEKARKKMGDE